MARKRRLFEPWKSVTVEEIEEFVDESLARNSRIYNRLAEI